MKPKPPRLKDVRSLLKKVYSWYSKHWKSLAPTELEKIESSMQNLSDEVLVEKKQFTEADWIYLKAFSRKKIKKGLFRFIREFLGAIIFAIIVATIIRQGWFELYEIPTGSMRPTLQEKDRLIVSKTDFGLNVPLTPKHFYFDEALVNRGGIFTFTAEDMDVYDPDQLYFYLFPGKKRLIKRCMGKPGDTLYFYGGEIYGFDKEGHEIHSFLSPEYYPNMVHIPYMTFVGKVKADSPNLLGEYQEITFHQMNQPLGKIELSSNGQFEGKIKVGDEWIKDEGPIASSNPKKIQSYGEFWGINNYAQTRIISKKEIQSIYNFNPTREYGDSEYYLELRHTPSLYTPLIKSHWKRSRRELPMLSTLFTFLPIDEELMERVFSNIYTTRFVVERERAKKYSIYPNRFSISDLPLLKNVPDGTYEYEDGIAYKLSLEGMRDPLPKDNPLMSFSPRLTQDLFNTGIDFLRVYEPSSNTLIYPQRYTYFKDGALYVMGRPLMEKDDPRLNDFIAKEQAKQKESSSSQPYKAFIDEGAPLLEDGSLDMEKVRSFGLKLPEKAYLALGDNYASSGDSRDFGFVPENNLRGGASMILWPFNKRWGAPAQTPYKFFTVPAVTVWVIVVICIGAVILYQKRQRKKPIYKKLSD